MGAAEGDHDVLTGGPVTGTTLADLPQAVRDTLKKRAPQGEVADIDRQVRDEKVIYKISFTNPAKNPALTISQDGKVIPARNNQQTIPVR
jgi:hypothetical protein